MSEENRLTPQLGKIRDIGAPSGKRARSKIFRAASRLRKLSKSPQFTGARTGRGVAVKFHQQSFAKIRNRRVVVKVHIARAGRGGGIGAFRAHISYLQRDGVERDGSGGKLYAREGETADRKSFIERGQNDRHQFRIIVSPEDGHLIEDMASNTRSLIAQMESDLGQRLDWVAVDHHNTGHSHTHIVVRGKERSGRDLVIARDYLTSGIRQRAEEILTQTLGPKRDLEILAAKKREVEQDRFTSLDQRLAAIDRDGTVRLDPASGSKNRFDRGLKLQRLKHLERLHLAQPQGKNVWNLKAGWAQVLKALGKRGDIIRSLSAAHSAELAAHEFRFWESRSATEPPLTGEVVASGPDDELRDKRFLVIRDFEGTHWHVPGVQDQAYPTGAVLEIGHQSAEPRVSDKTIAKIALRHGGVYSIDLHAKYDPTSTTAFREAHKRRLEALRRAGHVERRSDGVWEIPEDYHQRASEFERSRGAARISVKSWLSVNDQIEAIGPAWIDEQEDSPGPRIRNARGKRRRVLDTRGSPARSTMLRSELEEAIRKHAIASGQSNFSLSVGARFSGKLTGSIDLAQGRMAIVSNGSRFVLMPWRREMTGLRERNLTLQRTGRGISYSIAGLKGREIAR